MLNQKDSTNAKGRSKARLVDDKDGAIRPEQHIQRGTKS
jgi:hypothetical protein